MIVTNDTPLRIAWLVSRVRPPDLSATFLVKGTFRIVPGRPAEPLEDALEPTGDVPHPEGPDENLRYEADFAPFKPRADVLIVGDCFVPGGKTADVLRTSVQLGSWSKSLAVIGDRTWRRGIVTSHTAPMPFTRIPLRYDRAFGGPGFAFNPIGRGIGDDRLPNLEDPGHLIQSSADRPPVAGFGPVHRTWAQRNQRLGTYDKKWLKERWPWPPDDFDWGHHQAAPSDQQLEYLTGNEAFVFENLHPVHPRLRGALPGLRPQVFVLYAGAAGLREIPLRLDTFWAAPAEERIVLVWRGLGPVKHLKMTDVAEVHVAVRPLAEPPFTPEQFAAELARRREEKVRAKVREEEAAKARGAALDAEIARMDELAKKHVAAFEKKMTEAAAAVATFPIDAAPLAADFPPSFLAERAAHLAEIRKMGVPSIQVPPPPPNPAAQIASANAGAAKAAAQFPELGLPAKPIDLPAEALPQDSPDWTRPRVEAHAAAKGSFAEQDLSGLDLSGLAAPGLDFSGADLAKSNLAGAKLAGAKLAAADLSGAKLSKADLSGADLSDADLTKADLTGASLRDTVLTNATLSGAKLPAVDAQGVRADGSDFEGAELPGAKLAGGSFVQACFDGAVLEKADFSKAVLRSASVEGARAAGARFEGAELGHLHAGEAPDFTGAVFRAARGPRSYWERARLDRADLSGAELPRADFAFASAKEARFDGSDLSQAGFSDACLDGASFVGANVFRGSFERASLRHADLRGANCYEAEFWNAVLDHAALQGANLKMTKLAGSA